MKTGVFPIRFGFSSQTLQGYDADRSPSLTEQPILYWLRRLVIAVEHLARPVGSELPIRPTYEPVEVARRPSTDPALKADLQAMQGQLAEIKELLVAERGEVIKEAYTVEEVARKTKLAKFTVRQACNKRRIKGAYKGKDGAWRVPHASLTEILKDGLPSE